MNVFKQIERRIDEQMKKLLGGGASGAGQPGGRELVEIHRAILEDVVAHVETLPRGRRVFPYDQLAVTIPVPDPSRRAAFDVAFVEGDALASAVRAFLAQEGCEMPASLQVETTLADEPMPDFADRGFHIRYGKAESSRSAVAGPAPSSRRQAAPRVLVTVLNGHADRETYELVRPVINIGRIAEVLDARQRLTRRNDIAFDESSDPPNSSVSRAHAHIRYDSGDQVYRLFDDSSAHGTSVFRDGRLTTVPPGGRGLRLESGDEVYFGQARVRFELPSDSD
jgi:hypothetical protein